MKVKLFFLFIIFHFQFTISNVSFSQSFHRTYGRWGAETGTCVQSTLDGNYVISSYTTVLGLGYEDAYLLKVDTAGTLLWSKTYGGSLSDKAYFVSTCTDGGFILTGVTSSFGAGNYDLYLIRTDSNGNLLWSTAVGGSGNDYGWNVVQTNDGGFLAAGYSTSFSNANWDGYLVKTNSGGILQWAKVFGGAQMDAFYGLANTNDGGYILTGASATHSAGSSDMWLLKLNSNGDTLWTKLYGRLTEDAGNAVIQTSDGGYMVVGDIHVSDTTGAHHAALLKTDSQGNMQWVNVYGSHPGSEIGYAVRQTPDEGYVLMGNTGAYGGGGNDMLLVKTSSSGGLMWSKTYGTTGDDDGWYFHKTPHEGNMIVAGTTSFGAGQYDVYLVNTDSLGNSFCHQTSPVPSVSSPLLQLSSGTIVISGGTASTPNTVTNIPNTITTDPCALVGIAENENKSYEVSIYPNPFSESAIIEVIGIQSSTIGFEFIMYDVFGREAIRLPITDHRLLITRGSLASGIYFYKLSSVEKITPIIIGTGKIVIE